MNRLEKTGVAIATAVSIAACDQAPSGGQLALENIAYGQNVVGTLDCSHGNPATLSMEVAEGDRPKTLAIEERGKLGAGVTVVYLGGTALEVIASDMPRSSAVEITAFYSQTIDRGPHTYGGVVTIGTPSQRAQDGIKANVSLSCDNQPYGNGSTEV